MNIDCNDKETCQHIFFECLTAKYIWSLLAYYLGANCRPGNFNQCWIEQVLPKYKLMHAVSIAAVCWAIWKTRNAVCFDNKKVQSPIEIVCVMICSFLAYWASLLNEDMKQQVLQGAEAVKMVALFFHKQNLQAHAQDGY